MIKLIIGICIGVTLYAILTAPEGGNE